MYIGMNELSMLKILFIIVSSHLLPIVAGLSYSSCASNSIPASTKASKLVPNTFHKLCPGVPSNSFSSNSLNHPLCGDGTPFSFFFTRPTHRKMNSDKLCKNSAFLL